MGLVWLTAVRPVLADSNTPLAQKMKLMAGAVKNLQHPGTPPAAENPLDDFKVLMDAALDCLDHSDDLAPAEVAKDPQRLRAFKAEFQLLLRKIAILEKALHLPADSASREAQIRAALAEVLVLKLDGHSKFKPN